MKKQISILLLLALAACSHNNGGGGGTDPSVVPNDEKADPVVPGPGLTPAQKASLKAFQAKNQLIPDTDAITFDAQHADDAAKTDQAKRLAKMSAETQQVLHRITSDCTIMVPKFVTTGDSSGAAGSQTHDDAVFSANGPRCPIDYDGTTHKVSKVISSNFPDLIKAQDPNLLSKLSMVDEQTSVTDDKMTTTDVALAKSSDQFVKTTHTTNYVKGKIANGVMAAYYAEATSDVKFELTESRAQLSGSMAMRMASYLDGNGAPVTKLYAKVSLELQDADHTTALMQFYGIDDHITVYVNGQPMAQEELKGLIGASIDFSNLPKAGTKLHQN